MTYEWTKYSHYKIEKKKSKWTLNYVKKYLWCWNKAANSCVPGFGKDCEPRSRSRTEADSCAAAVPPSEYDLGPMPFSGE